MSFELLLERDTCLVIREREMQGMGEKGVGGGFGHLANTPPVAHCF